MQMWEDPENADEWYNNMKQRKNFASYVFLITGLMLLVASVIIILPLASDEIQEAFVHNMMLISIIALIGGTVSMLVLVCVYKARHSFPINIILLTVLCVSYGLIAAIASTKYSTYVVLISFGATVVIVLLVGIAAKWGPFDITGCGMLMCGISIALSVVLLGSIIFGFFMHIPLLHLVISCVVVLAYTIFLLYDMQLIIGGRREELARDEYILGAVILFKDIIVIFIYLMEIIAAIFGNRE